MAVDEDGRIVATSGMVFENGTVYTGADLDAVMEATLGPGGGNADVAVFERDAGQDPTGVNTTTSLQARISGVCPAMRGGLYLVVVSYRWSHDAQTSDFRSVFSFDGSPLTVRSNGDTHLQEPKDSAGVNTDSTGTDQAHAYTHVSPVTIAEDATPAVLLEWASTAGGVEASIWDDSVTVMRVGP